MPKNREPRFDVHPSVVYQLGESLITDSVQALIELVKNCYDADASYAKVTIDTEGSVKVPDADYPPTGGRIIVEDDGHGMDLEAIESGWLLISNRKKRDMKQAKRTTPGGRTPLGDKGLGRLGVQRLGQNLDIFTKCRAESAYHLAFSWLDFAAAPKLSDVDVHLRDTAYPGKSGTKIVVSSLRDVDTWRGLGAIKRLERELSRMLSPYEQNRQFMVLVEVDGKRVQLLEVSERIRDLAPVRYRIAFDGQKMSIEGRASLNFFRPNSQEDVELFARLAEADKGRAFYEFLSSHKRARDLRLSQLRDAKWFVGFRCEKALDSLDGCQRDETRGDSIANPGPFTGEVDSFDLGSMAFRAQSVFDLQSEFRNHIKALSGIGVYRDGFAIRVGEDWLRLGAQWTSATSYYGLKPDTTLGYIALTARHNTDLEETTDREGFKDTPYYRNFYALLMDFQKFTARAHDFFGRSWGEFRKRHNAEFASVESHTTAEDLSRSIKRGLSEAPAHRQSLDTLQTSLEAGVKKSRAVTTKLGSAKKLAPAVREVVDETLSLLKGLQAQVSSEMPTVSRYLDELASLESTGQVLEDRVDSLRHQIDDMYETVALGLTAEALSHEVFNIADQLARRAKAARNRLRKMDVADRKMLSFVEYVDSAVMALRKQVSYLSPSLRYVREQRHNIAAREFLLDLSEFYRERLARGKIKVEVAQKSQDSLTLRMNKGKLSQIIDNFVLNSEYWLREDISQKRIAGGTIFFEVERPFVRIWDNGRGIDPSVEHALFEPFISAKGSGQGRGLGLFIVKQLLDSEGCHVGLLPKRNRHRRLFRFQIDFRGALSE